MDLTPRIRRIEPGLYRHFNDDPLRGFIIERYHGTRTIKRNGYQERPVPLWRYRLGSGERGDGFKYREECIDACIARWRGAEARAATLRPTVGKPRRPTSFVLVERGLFDAADGMPYVPNVEAKKDSA